MKKKTKKYLYIALAVTILSLIGFYLFVLLMCYLVACGVAAGYQIQI